MSKTLGRLFGGYGRAFSSEVAWFAPTHRFSEAPRHFGHVLSRDLGRSGSISGPADISGLDFGGQNGTIFEVWRRSCTFGANFVRTQQKIVKTGKQGTSELSCHTTKATKNRSEGAFKAARCTTGAQNGSPGGSWSVFGAARGRFWTAPGRSWLARDVPRSALEQYLGVQKPSRARPDACPKRPWAPKTIQDRFFVDFGSV